MFNKQIICSFYDEYSMKNKFYTRNSVPVQGANAPVMFTVVGRQGY